MFSINDILGYLSLKKTVFFSCFFTFGWKKQKKRNSLNKTNLQNKNRKNLVNSKFFLFFCLFGDIGAQRGARTHDPGICHRVHVAVKTTQSELIMMFIMIL